MSIFVVLLLGTLGSQCDNIMSHMTARINETSSCLTVIDSIFSFLSDTNGGAIYFSVTTNSSIITGSSFLSCQATERGGGCYINSSQSSVSLSCGQNCSAGSHGHFIDSSGSGQHSFDVVGVSNCFETSTTTLGTLRFASSMVVNISNLNLTDCSAYQGSCASASPDSNVVQLTCRYSSFAKNSGESGLYGARAVGGRGWFLMFCDFFNNAVTGGVLYAYNYGMTVNDCHFSGNKADIGGSVTQGKFTITNSIFSDNFPSSNIASSSNCSIASTQLLRPITTRLCPTYSVSMSPSGSPSADFSASLPLADSHHFSLSGRWLTSAEFCCSEELTASVIVHSDAFSGTKSISHTSDHCQSDLSIDSNPFMRTLLRHSRSFERTVLCVSESFHHSFQFNSESFQQTLLSIRETTWIGLSEPTVESFVGLIIGLVVGVFVVSVIVFLIVLQILKWRKAVWSSQDETPIRDARFFPDTVQGTENETFVTYADSLTSDGCSAETVSAGSLFNTLV
jgi:hypothetical protein